MSACCLAEWQAVIVTIYGIRTAADERGRVFHPSGGFLLIFFWCVFRTATAVFSICCFASAIAIAVDLPHVHNNAKKWKS